MNIKRIALISGFVLVVLGVGFLIYYIFFSPTPPAVTPPTEQPPVSGEFPLPGEFIPPTGEVPPGEFPGGERPPSEAPEGAPVAGSVTEAKGGTVQTTEVEGSRNKTIMPVISGEGVATFDSFDGKFYRITADGQSEALTDQTFIGADTVTFAPGADKAVIEFFDGSNIMYDFTTKTQVTLPKHWNDFSFAPNGGQLAFKSIGGSSESNWLAISNDDGSGGQQIEHLGKNGGLVDVNWSPSDQIVATFREGVDGFNQRIYFIGKNGENFNATTVNGRDFTPQWSPGGDRLVYSVYSPDSDMKPQLWVVDALGDTIGNNRRNLQINTWADKCAFANDDTMYCGVPSLMDTGAGVVRSLSDNQPDHLYRINIRNGEKVKVAEPEGRHTVSNMVITDNTIFFTDKASGKLYSIAL